jgi:maltose O-acetyltransferase
MNDAAPSRPGLSERLLIAFREDFGQIRPRHRMLGVVSGFIPRQVGAGVRASLLRFWGAKVGERCQLLDMPDFSGGPTRGLVNLTLGNDCTLDIGCQLEIGQTITLGDRVTLGHAVMVLTTTHELGPREHRAGTFVQRPVVIESGVWVGPRCVILPGVTIGAGAIVEAGSVVNKDVVPNTRVRGIPARQVEELAP